MDNDIQKNHLKSYGLAYWVLDNILEVDWLLNYRGGSFMCDFFPFKENNRIYMTSLYCSDDLIDSSRENFNKILNSIEIK